MKTLFAAILLLASTAHAVDFELSGGISKYQQSDNGTWWQNPFPNSFEMTTTSFGIGVTDYLTDAVRWRVGYTHLGNVSSYAEAVGNDNNYNGVDGCVGPCMLMSHWYGKGYAQGIYATLAPEYSFGKVKVFVEGGLWYYDPAFSMTVPDWYSGPGDTTPKFVQVDHEEGNQIGPVFGFGIEYDKTQLVMRWFKTEANGNPDTVAIYQKYTVNLSIRRIF